MLCPCRFGALLPNTATKCANYDAGLGKQNDPFILRLWEATGCNAEFRFSPADTASRSEPAAFAGMPEGASPRMRARIVEIRDLAPE